MKRRVLVLFLILTFLVPEISITAESSLQDEDPQENRNIHFQELRNSFWSGYSQNAEVQEYLSASINFAKKYRFGPGGYDPAAAFYRTFDPEFTFFKDFNCPTDERELLSLSPDHVCRLQFEARKQYEENREKAFALSHELDEIEEKRLAFRTSVYQLDDGNYTREASVVPVTPADVSLVGKKSGKNWIFPVEIQVAVGGNHVYAAEEGDGIAGKAVFDYYEKREIGLLERMIVDGFVTMTQSIRKLFGIQDPMIMVFEPDKMYGTGGSEFGTFPGAVYDAIMAFHQAIRRYLLIPILIALILYGVIVLFRSGSPDALTQAKEGIFAVFGGLILLSFGDIVWGLVFYVIDIIVSMIRYGMESALHINAGQTFETILFGSKGLDGFTQLAPGWMVMLLSLAYVFVGAILTYQYVIRMIYLGVLIMVFPFVIAMGMYPGYKGQVRVWLGEFIGHASLPVAHAATIFIFFALFEPIKKGDSGMNLLVIFIFLFALSQVANVIKRVLIPQFAGGHETYQASGGIAGLAASSFVLLSGVARGSGGRGGTRQPTPRGERTGGEAPRQRFDTRGAVTGTGAPGQRGRTDGLGGPGRGGKSGSPGSPGYRSGVGTGDVSGVISHASDGGVNSKDMGLVANDDRSHGVPAVSNEKGSAVAVSGRTATATNPPSKMNRAANVLRTAGRGAVFAWRAAKPIMKGAAITSAATGAMVMQGMLTGQINPSTGLAAGMVAGHGADRVLSATERIAPDAARVAGKGTVWMGRQMREGAKILADAEANVPPPFWALGKGQNVKAEIVNDPEIITKMDHVFPSPVIDVDPPYLPSSTSTQSTQTSQAVKPSFVAPAQSLKSPPQASSPTQTSQPSSRPSQMKPLKPSASAPKTSSSPSKPSSSSPSVPNAPRRDPDKNKGGGK